MDRENHTKYKSYYLYIPKEIELGKDATNSLKTIKALYI